MIYAISVILCTYTEQRWDDLLTAIESVHLQALQADEIIVVVDHNLPLLAKVQKHLPDVIAIENTQTRGLSGARNSGVAAASNDILAFLDDDAVATPDWLLFLNVSFVRAEVLGAGGAILPRWTRQKPGWFPEEFYWVLGCTYQGLPEQNGTVRNLIGANMAFRRELFEREEGFRTDIGRIGTHPLGCEETEFCIRAKRKWPQRCFLYQPQARVFHRIPDQRARWSYFCSRCYFEGVSKAGISHYVGARASLASERAYTFRTLPQGFARGICETLFHFDPTGITRAGAILAGLVITAIGYLAGSLHWYLSKIPSISHKTGDAPTSVEAPRSFTTHTGY